MSIKPTHVDDATKDKKSRHIVPLSGGKDSTALAIYLNQRNPETNYEYVFSDTGAELPETYDYFERLEHVLGQKINRVTAFDLVNVAEKHGRSPFDAVLYEHFSGFLPSPRSRWCTRMLKIIPFEKFIDGDKAYSYIGIRADEKRKGYTSNGGKPVLMSEEPNITPVYPFKDYGLTIVDIRHILEDSGLGQAGYYEWRSRSGCYFCFYQQLAEWQGLKEHHPNLFESAKEYEKGKNGRKFTWVDGRPLEQVEKMPRREIKPKSDEDGCAICHL